MKYLFIAIFFVACHHPDRKDSVKVSAELLDTVTTVRASQYVKPDLFETAFIKGTTQKGKDSIIHLFGITIGKLKISSGHVIACDPLHIDEYGITFTQVFPTGEFPVQLAIAKLNEEERIAFARIYFSDEAVVKWELALLKGQSPLALASEEIHGYGVDGGIGIFMDEKASKALDANQLSQMEDTLYTQMARHMHNGWRYTMYNVGEYNLAAFTTGFGDGRYATYIGFDANGKPCRLLSDFGLFAWRRML